MQRIKKKIFVYIDSKNDEDGFTLLSSLLRLMMISIVLPLLLFILTKITVLPMQSSMSVHQLFFIIQNELYRAREVTNSKNQLTYINEEGKDRKSTRLNSSHDSISYAVFCLKKKKHKVSQRS